MNLQGRHRFVVAAQQSDGRRVIFRNYQVPYEVPRDFTIVEACLATSAAPLIFRPLRKDAGSNKEYYVDGGLGNTNPVSIVLQECRSLWPRSGVSSLISVGTGARVPGEVKQNLVSVAKKVTEMIVDAANEAQEFESNIRLTDPEVYSAYFRLDVGEAMGGIHLDEWRMLGAISQRTRSWVSANHDRLERCARGLGAKKIGCKDPTDFPR
jgi:hypothetical protein